ncbi:MAG: Nramp family divalent metal transporter [Opitutales bacterium]
MSDTPTIGERIGKMIAIFLPGIFLLGFNIGTGSVTAMAKAGATYGMSLLWTILASCLTTYFLIGLYGKFTLVTGETALAAFRKHIHPVVGLFFVVGLGFGVCGSVMGVMGIVADICYEWSKTMVDGGIKPIYFAGFFVALVYFIFWNGKTKIFERVLAVIVAVMALCFLVNFFIMMPSPVSIIQGLIPNVPNVDEASGQSAFLVIASMVGTTVFPGLFIIRTTLVKEAGWTLKDLKQQRLDAAVSASLMFLISGAIMAAAAGTLYASGIGLEKASQMISLLEPVAGSLATAIFAIGIISAGVSSQFPNVLLLPWLICDYRDSKRDMTLLQYRVVVLLISLLGLVVPIFDARPVLVMIISQAFNSFLLPATVLCILYVANRESIMGEHKNNMRTNVILVAILLFSCVTTWMGLQGLFKLLGQL